MGYVYRHIRLDSGNPFYIGISNDNDGIYKRAFSKEFRNNLWKKIISKTNYEVEILFEHDDYEFIKEKEKEFISLYGRINTNTGILSNLTNGGEGTLGYVQSKEMIEDRVLKVTGKKRTQEQKDYMSSKMKGVKRSAQSCENISKSKLGHSYNKGIPKTDEHRKKLSNSKKMFYKNNPNTFKDNGKSNTCAKKIINTYTKEIFNSIKDAAKSLGFTDNKMGKMLRGITYNTTSLIYYIKKEEI